jgi:hypothetical protein
MLKKILSFFISVLFIISCSALESNRYDSINVKPSFSLDPEFSSYQKYLIIEGANQWYSHTNGFVNLRLDSGQKCPGFVKIDHNSKNIAKLDYILGGSTLGYYNHKTRCIYLVTDRLGNDEQFVTVVMHEIGHFLGLDHAENGFAVMNSEINIGQNANMKFTITDAKEFCYHYDYECNNFIISK